MSKRIGKSGTVTLLSGIVGLMTSCGPAPSPTVNVKPIPPVLPTSIAQTPVPSSSLLPIPPVPGQTPLPTGSATPVPGTPIPTPTPSVIPGQLAIQTTTLPTAALNFTYNTALSAIGGSGSYRWNLAAGSLPNGLILDQATGQVFGRPTQTGTFSFEIQVIDTAGNAARRSMFILVSDTNSGINSVGILTTSLASGTVDRRYSQSLSVSGGTPPYAWSISSGALPDGLEINPTTGEISGTPNLESEETFTVRVVDARGQVATKTLSITINRTDSDISILTADLPIGVLGQPYQRTACGTVYSGQLVATGGNNVYTWQKSSGTLPPGLTLSSSGLLSGTPTSNGSYTFTVRVSDSDNNRASKVFTVDVRDLVIHRFSPNSGGEGLRMVIEGENLASVDQVSLGGSAPVTPNSINTADPTCHQVEINIPDDARTGSVVLTDSGSGATGSSTMPFIDTDVVINEVFTNPDNSGNQFVELRNKGTSSASIAGWHLRYTDSNGNLADFTIPPETPPLAANAVTVIHLNRAGGNTASHLFTGTGLAEMRFNPTAATDNLTEVALCVDAACTVTATDTKIRDYMVFGSSGSPSGTLQMQDEAATSGIWTTGDVLGVVQLMGTLDTANINASNAHNGTADGTPNQGLLLLSGESSRFAPGDMVVFDNFATGGKVYRLKRTVQGLNGDRVTLDQPLFTATIQSSNTGNGTAGNGLLVDKIEETYSALSLMDFVNVLAGGTIRTIIGLPTAGPKIELDNALYAQIQPSNTSDGTAAGSDPLPAISGFTVDNSTIVAGSPTVSITIGQGTANEFTVVRNLVSTPDATHVVIDQPLASAPVSATNTGDGLPGSGIAVTSTTHFITGRTARWNGINRLITVSGSTFELDSPLASLSIAPTNTGTGAAGSEIQVTSTTGFSNTNKVRINGVIRTIANILNSPPRVQLDQPLSMTIAGNTTGDGTPGNGINVSSTQGFVTGNQVSIAGQSRTITVVGTKLELDTPIGTSVDSTNMGDGSATAFMTLTDASAFAVGNTLRFPSLNLTRTISNKIGNTIQLNNPLLSANVSGNNGVDTVTVNSAAGFAVGNKVRFSATGQVATITAISGNNVTIDMVPTMTTGTMTLVPQGIAVNLVPTAGTIVMQGNSNSADYIDTLNLVPTGSAFTLVPVNPLEDVLSRIPTSGSVWLAPASGTLRQFRSIKYTGSGNSSANFNTTSAPTLGSP